MLYFPLSSVLLAVTDFGVLSMQGHGYRKSLMRRFFLPITLRREEEFARNPFQTARHQARWPTFASVKPNGDGRRRDKE